MLLAAAMMIGTAATARAQIDKLPHPDTTSGNFFGVAVSIDGHRALVGASSEDTCDTNAGAAYIFEQDAATNHWAEVARLVPDFVNRRLAPPNSLTRAMGPPVTR